MAKTSLSKEALLEARIAALLAPHVEPGGYELVRVALTGPGRQTLQIMVERADRATMNVDHCAAVSRAVAAVLDADETMADAFTLEVSSPGLDRPLTTLDHYRRFKGFDIRLELATGMAGRRRYTGRLAEVDETAAEALIVLTAADGPVRLRFADISKAKLVLNDHLLAAARDWAEAGRSP